MNSHLSTLAIFSTFALAAGCASSGISGTTETTGIVTSSVGGAGQTPHSRGSCTSSNTLIAPANGLIADFSPVGGGANGQGIQIPGGIVTYDSSKLGGTGSLTYTITGGSLNIRVSAPAISRPQFLGAIVQFDSCIDASAFTGIQFTISGSFSDCGLVYMTGDVEHEDVTISSSFASGPAGSYPPQKKFSVADLASTPRTIKQPFVGSDIQGNPATPIDPTKLVLTSWQFIVPIAADDGSTTPMCTGNLTIDDIKFYR
jgi:hypothetical protein